MTAARGGGQSGRESGWACVASLPGPKGEVTGGDPPCADTGGLLDGTARAAEGQGRSPPSQAPTRPRAAVGSGPGPVAVTTPAGGAVRCGGRPWLRVVRCGG